MNKRKSVSIWSSLIWFTLIGFLRPAIHVFLLPLYLLKISPSEYGILSLVLIFASLMGSLSGLKLNIASNTFYYDFYKDRPQLERYLGQIFSSTLIIGFLLFFLISLVGPYIFDLTFVSKDVLFYPYGILAIGHALISSINSIYFAYLRNELKIKEFIIINIVAILTTVMLQAVFILIYELSILGILLGSIIPSLSMMIYISFKNPWLLSFKLDYQLLKPSLKFGVGFLPISFLVIFERQIDRLFIERFLNLEQVGLYSILLSIAGFFTIFIGAFQNAIRPNVYESLKENNAETPTNVNNIFRQYSSFGSFALASVFLIGNHFYLITDNPKYLKIIDYFPYIVIATVPLILLRFQVLVILYYKKTKLLSIVTLIKVIVMAFIMFLLIPKYGIIGAIISLMISYITYAIILYFVEQRLSDKMLDYLSPILRNIPLVSFLLINEFYMPSGHRSLLSIVIFICTTLTIFIVEKERIILFLKSFRKSPI